MSTDKYNVISIPNDLMFYSYEVMNKHVYYFVLPNDPEKKEMSFFIRPDWMVKVTKEGYNVSFFENELVPVFKKTTNLSSKDYQNNIEFKIIKEAYKNA